MANRTCSIEGCTNVAHARGMCTTHRNRVTQHGDPMVVNPRGPVPIPPIDRILSRVTHVGECWLYGLELKADHPDVVVGSNVDGTRRKARAYRVVYEALVGPIPEGQIVHHKCHNGRCVRPDHLEVMDRGEHTRQHKPRRGTGREVAAW